MAREKEHTLYQKLVEVRFSFISEGTHHIDEIYNLVSKEYSELCDNTYYCSENCSSGNNQPEWKHTIRNALQRLKNSTDCVKFTGQRGYWVFK